MKQAAAYARYSSLCTHFVKERDKFIIHGSVLGIINFQQPKKAVK